jgi:hypothetical protein
LGPDRSWHGDNAGDGKWRKSAHALQEMLAAPGGAPKAKDSLDRIV